MRKMYIQALFVALITIIFLFYLDFQNNCLMTTMIEYKKTKIPKSFDNYKILQVSDLHNAEFDDDNKRLIKLIKEQNADIIVMTGDIIDKRNTDIEFSKSFVRQAADIAPVYYISGNHELAVGKDYDEFKAELEGYGVVFLDDDATYIYKNDEKFRLCGISGKSFDFGINYYEIPESMHNKVKHIYPTEDEFTVLLSHRPEVFKYYIKQNVDLVLCGHAHGGQIRLPFIGALTAPNQGFFPKYTKGAYTENNTTMIVSRGLGNSALLNQRISNRPEIVLITLKCE